MVPTAAPPRRIHSLVSFLLIATLATFATPCDASEVGQVARRMLDLSPERVDAFNAALRHFGERAPDSSELYLQAWYAPERIPTPSCLSGDDAEDDVRVPWGRDLSHESEFLMEGREKDYERAARRWVTRTLRGSDAAALAADSRRSWQPHYDWNDGPVIGARRGMVSMTAGWNSDWRVRLTRPIRQHPGWTWRAWIGERDGERIAGFTIGRSLFASTR